jgi:hypothetical protein
MMDLDRKSFDTDEQLEQALQTTLANIDKNVIGIPNASENVTVTESGNGFHVLLPLYWKSPLEDMVEFENFRGQDLATRFMRWAEYQLTEGKADKCHNPSTRNCLFRMPGTLNTRARAAGKQDPFVRFKQVSRWALIGKHCDSDDSRAMPRVKNEFLMKFHTHLVQELIDEKVEKQERRQKLSMGLFRNVNSIVWIDKLLQTPVSDSRKGLLYWVLSPYLITVRGLDYDKAYAVLDAWLVGCDAVRKLEPDLNSFRYRIRYCLDAAESHERRPIRFGTLKQYYPDIYKSLKLDGGA